MKTKKRIPSCRLKRTRETMMMVSKRKKVGFKNLIESWDIIIFRK